MGGDGGNPAKGTVKTNPRRPYAFIAFGLVAAVSGAICGWQFAGHGTGGHNYAPPADPAPEVLLPPGRTDLLAGAQWLAATEGQEEFRETVSLEAGYHEVRVRAVFDVPQPPDGFLNLRASRSLEGWLLNAKPLQQPMEELKSETIASIPASMLVAGHNVLEVPFSAYLDAPAEGPAAKVLKLDAVLYRQLAEDLAFELGPILGCAGEDFFTVTCRTSVPAVVTLKVDGKAFVDDGGIYHSLKATGLKPGTRYEYMLTAALVGVEHSASCGPYPVKMLPAGDKLVFATVGDNREGTNIWRQISQRVLKSGADFAVHSGDAVYSGQVDKWWIQQYWRPAEEFCASMPCFHIMGNHEKSVAVFRRVFATPSGSANWQQQAGPALLIGLDSYKGDWSPDGENMKWLESVLSASKARFIFMFAHHPPYSTVEAGGYENMRGPYALLEKYGGTAMVCGHAHGYERSEPGGQTSMIISAGAGAPLYHAQDPASNPHSKVLLSVYNYCLFTIDGDTCTMKALGFGDDKDAKLGEPTVIDTRTWKAREVK